MAVCHTRHRPYGLLQKWPAYHCFAEEAVAGSERVIAVSADNRDLALSGASGGCGQAAPAPQPSYNEDIFYREEVDGEAIFDSPWPSHRGEYIGPVCWKAGGLQGVDTLLRGGAPL
ncbi:MAG: hypothetical protein ACLUEU_09835 [Oscillospiraceae bacterium]